MTFSLLGHCATTGQVGVVVSSSSPAVAARCAFVRAGVGVAASQNVTDPRLGPALLDALERTSDPAAALDAVVRASEHRESRQLALLDAAGWGAAWSGAQTLGLHGHRVGPGCVAAGNLLSSTSVLDALIDAFVAAPAAGLGERLLSAADAALSAGGEAGPLRSAGLLLADAVEWPIADLRVDWHDAPIDELAALWQVWHPQMDDYVARALRPDAAPAFGVPGEERTA